jgi:hypothetical protein
MKKPPDRMAGFSVYIEKIRRLAVLRQALLLNRSFGFSLNGS